MPCMHSAACKPLTARMRSTCSLFADSDFFGTAMGITESFLSLAWVIGPLLGGYAADVAGFAAPFVLTALLALLSAPVLAWLMPPGDHTLHIVLCHALLKGSAESQFMLHGQVHIVELRSLHGSSSRL